MSFLELYPWFFAILLPVAFLAFFLTGAFHDFAKRAHLLPKIRSRDVHTVAKPRVGGVAMWLTALIAFLIIAGGGKSAILLQFGHRHILGLDSALLGILAGMLVILVVGLLDDLYNLSAKVQLVGQFVAGLCLVASGVGVPFIRLPFDHQLSLTSWAIHVPHTLGSGTLYVWSALFTLVWIVAIINVMNFFDGLDGLAGSVAFTAALTLLFVSLKFGYTATATLSVVLAGITAGFLPWNWYPSRIFMGTVGSQLLGFLLGVIAIISGGKLATAVLVLGIPFFDALIVIIRRLLAHQSPFQADQRHLHHRLLKIGLSTPVVVVLINAVAIIFGVLALSTQRSTEKGFLTLLLAVCMIGVIIFTYALERRAVRQYTKP